MMALNVVFLFRQKSVHRGYISDEVDDRNLTQELPSSEHFYAYSKLNKEKSNVLNYASLNPNATKMDKIHR